MYLYIAHILRIGIRHLGKHVYIIFYENRKSVVFV